MFGSGTVYSKECQVEYIAGTHTAGSTKLSISQWPCTPGSNRLSVWFRDCMLQGVPSWVYSTIAGLYTPGGTKWSVFRRNCILQGVVPSWVYIAGLYTLGSTKWSVFRRNCILQGVPSWVYIAGTVYSREYQVECNTQGLYTPGSTTFSAYRRNCILQGAPSWVCHRDCIVQRVQS